MKLSQLAAVSLGLLVSLGPVTAGHAQSTYPPAAENGQVSDTSITPGECVTFSGSGFVPGTPVQVTDDGQAVTTVTAGADGSFSVQLCPKVLGVHILRGSGTGTDLGTRVVSAVVNVLSAGLAGTGSSRTLPLGLVGAGLVVAGAAAVVTASRRRRLAAA